MSLGCPGQGQGKVCKTLGTKMTRMTDYMIEINRKIGYESLKSKHFKAYPELGKKVSLNIVDEQYIDEDKDESSSDEIKAIRSEVKSLKEKLDLAERNSKILSTLINVYIKLKETTI